MDLSEYSSRDEAELPQRNNGTIQQTTADEIQKAPKILVSCPKNFKGLREIKMYVVAMYVFVLRKDAKLAMFRG